MKIGFTGTSRGMNRRQQAAFLALIQRLKKSTTEFHHGDRQIVDRTELLIAASQGDREVLRSST